jgi:hypothetical protein
MKDQLYLNLHGKWFVEILEGRKDIEYRDRTDFWRGKLYDEDGKPKPYKTIYFRNGYREKAPIMIVKLLRIEESESQGKFLLHLGEILVRYNTNLLAV